MANRKELFCVIEEQTRLSLDSAVDCNVTMAALANVAWTPYGSVRYWYSYIFISHSTSFPCHEGIHSIALLRWNTNQRTSLRIFVAGTRPLSHRISRSVHPSVRRSVTLCFFCIFGHFKGWKVCIWACTCPNYYCPSKSLLPLPNRPRQEQSCIRPC